MRKRGLFRLRRPFGFGIITDMFRKMILVTKLCLSAGPGLLCLLPGAARGAGSDGTLSGIGPVARQPRQIAGTVDITDAYSSFAVPQTDAPFGWAVAMDAGELVSSVEIDGRRVAQHPVNRAFWFGAETMSFVPDGPKHSLSFPKPANTIPRPTNFTTPLLRQMTSPSIGTLSAENTIRNSARLLKKIIPISLLLQ